MAKSYAELEFTDNFMFVKVLSSNPELCRELIELILPIKIHRLNIIGYEKSVETMFDSKGIRFDVYAADDDQSLYDIEMQASPDAHLPKRSRYYHSMMDMEQLQKGELYAKLKKSFVIFICKTKMRDGFDQPVYTFRYQSQEDPSVYLEDETWTVLVNADCDDSSLSAEMKEFLRFIRTGKAEGAENSLASRISRIIADAKTSGKWSAEYMRWEDELNLKYAEGLEQGIEQGIKQGIEQGRALEQENTAAERRRADTAEQELLRYIEKFGRIEN